MGQLGREARALQNPAFCGILLWAFCREYYDSHSTHNGAPFALTFLVLPMVLHEGTRQLILGTQPSSGLRFFTEKFSSPQIAQSDALATLQRRVEITRKLTMDSMQMLLGCGLLSLEPESGFLLASKARGLPQQIPESMDPLIRAAKRLGRWTSALTVYEVTATLRLAF